MPGRLYWAVTLLRLGASAALKEKRLAALVEGREADVAAAQDAVRRAQAAGSLELSGIEPATEEIGRLLRARDAVDPGAPFTVDALLAWHRAATGSSAGLRRGPKSRDGGPPPAPPEFVAMRVQNLQEWLGVESSAALKPSQRGALLLARIVEILPFDDGNGRVARLAAAHAMEAAGSRPPILTGDDRARLVQSLQAAFQLQTEPLASLLDESAERALDVMIRTVQLRAR